MHAAPPPAYDVFVVQTQILDPNTLLLTWHIKPGFFLYQDSISIIPDKSAELQLGKIKLPKPLLKTDKLGKRYPVYRDDLLVPVNVLSPKPQETILAVKYQGCADDGFCYPPEVAHIKLSFTVQNGLTGVSLEQEERLAPPITQAESPESLIANKSLLFSLLSFYALGLLLSFTPCMLPMIPVLSGIIVGQGNAITTRKAFLLSLSYVLSMAGAYALVGAIIATMGENLQLLLQTSWVIITVSGLFVLLSLSMFDVYQLQLPQGIQMRLSGYSRRHGGQYLGAAIMGALSTLVLSPCVTAPLIGVLSYIASTGNTTLGMLALFCLGLGMGTPLLVIGTSAGKWLPKAGHWMNGVKSFFGFLLLGMAIFILSRVITEWLTLVLYLSLSLTMSIYYGYPLATSRGLSAGSKILGVIFLGISVYMGVELATFKPIDATQVIVVTTLSETQLAIQQAQGHPVMLDFYADWCTSCKVMEKTTLRNPAVLKALANYRVIKVDITKNSDEQLKLLDTYHVVAPPTYIFLNANGQEVSASRLVGDVDAKTFLKSLTILP